MSMISNKAAIPADDPRRNLVVANPDMAMAVAVGATPTSQEVSGLGEAALFSRLHKTSLGLCVSDG